MSNLIVLLIAVATAFPAGWLLCRAWLRANDDTSGEVISKDKHHTLLQAQRSRYRGQVQRIRKLIDRHEAARDQIRKKLDASEELSASQQEQNQRLQEQLESNRRALAATRTELEDQQARGGKLLEEAQQAATSVEDLQTARDRLAAELKEQKHALAQAMKRQESAEDRAERGAMREKLASAEHRQRELETRLADRDAKIVELEQSVESWKHRVAPLARQIQNYREAIRKLQQGDTAPASARAQAETATDDLQKIRGIGPALERRLNANGIRAFSQIVLLDPIELAELADRLAIAPSLPERDEWIRQARELSEPDQAAAAV